MNKKSSKSRLPIGYIESNRQIISYNEHRTNIYAIECNNCKHVIMGNANTLKSPCKKCSYKKSGDLQDLRLQVLYKYKYNAEKRGYKFLLTNEEFFSLIERECYYCGNVPETVWKSHRKENNTVVYNGVDRKDNSLGYTIENSCSCCKKCNYIKNSMGLEDFKNIVIKWSERVNKW